QQPEAALTDLGRALALARQTEQSEDAGFWLLRLGDAQLQLGRAEAAETSYRQALAYGERLRHPRMVREATIGLGATRAAGGDDPGAIAHYREAIRNLEAERNRLVLEKEQSGFLEDKTEVYEKIIQALVRLHRREPGRDYAQQAFHYNERAKAQAFLQKLPQGQFLKQLKSLSPAYGEWAARHQSALDQNYRQLIKKHAELQVDFRLDMNGWGPAAPGTTDPTPAMTVRRQEIAALESQIDRLETEY